MVLGLKWSVLKMSNSIEILIKSIVLIMILMGAAAYMTFCERVVMARMQLRLGPNRVGPLGLWQPLADGIKLLCKESFRPAGADALTYALAPAITLFTALFAFVLIPFGDTIQLWGHTVALYIANVDVGILLILAVSSLAVYGVFLAGWGSNNRYALLGGLRATAQMISYEIPMSLALLTVVVASGTLRLPEIVQMQREHWFIWTNPLSFIIYLIAAFAETNRAPFDLPESEQELTAGYHTEYGGMKFAMFFMAEYINILAVSAIMVTFFFGGWLGPFDIPILWFICKIAIVVFLFLWVRATMARFRYGELMSFSWKILLPLSIINLIITTYFTVV